MLKLLTEKRTPRNKHVRFTSNVLRSAGIVNDAVCFMIAFALSAMIYAWLIGYYYDFRLHVNGAIVMAINFLLIRISRDAYSDFRGQGDDVGQGALLDFLVAATLTALTITEFGVLEDFSRGLGAIFIVVSLALLFLSRMVFRKTAWLLMEMGVIGQRVAVYGEDAAITTRLLEILEIERLPHLKVIGYADDRQNRTVTLPIDHLPFLGGFENILALAQEGELDQVILALPKVKQERLDMIVEQLSAAAIDVCMMPREVLELRTSYRVNFVGSIPVFNVWQQPVRDFDGAFKAILDRFLAIFGLIFLSPLLILTAIAIKLESHGPVFFQQKRFGFNNLEINVLKFRSMYVDRQDPTGAERTRKGDARVTRVGRIIRRLSIDELPQLFNVLAGDMSIVGPRPHATEMRVGEKFYLDAVRGYAARHRVKPGITGLAQVRGLRGEIATVERAKKRVEYDLYYIENWSPLLDIRIIIETLFKLVWDRHAY